MTDKPYTPTTDRIRDLFSFAVAWDAEPTEPHIIAMQDKARKGFDRWLDARDDKLITTAEQRGKEQGWDEGYQDGYNDGLSDGHSLDNMRDPNENPYRADQEGDHE